MKKRQSLRSPTIHVPADHVALRVVCHASLVGGIIGPNGAVVSQLRRETGTKIHCHQPVNGSEHWVVIIVGSTAIDNRIVLTDGIGSGTDCVVRESLKCEVSAVQTALIRVIERIWLTLAENDDIGRSDKEGEDAYCGILADNKQIGAVLGKGGRNVEWMRRETGAKIRVLPPPACGTKSDELIQVTGKFLGVKKALVLVSGCLQDCPPLDGYPHPLSSSRSFERYVQGASEDPHSEFFPHLSSLSHANNTMKGVSSIPHLPDKEDDYTDVKPTEQKVVFKMICSSVAAKGIIGERGAVVRSLQNETGASISISAPSAVTRHQIVTISARENLESWYSPAQNALIIVFTRSVEIDRENGVLREGALVRARLLVASHLADGLSTDVDGTDVRVLREDPILNYISEKKAVVVEIVGEMKGMHKALSQVTTKLRESLIPKKVLDEVRGSNPYEHVYLGSDHDTIQTQEMHPYHQNVNGGGSSDGSVTELNKSLDFLLTLKGLKGAAESTNGEHEKTYSSRRKQTVSLRNITLEIAVREDALSTLHGRNRHGLDHLQQVSGVKVEVQEPVGGERTIIMSGSPLQIRAALELTTSILASQ